MIAPMLLSRLGLSSKSCLDGILASDGRDSVCLVCDLR